MTSLTLGATRTAGWLRGPGFDLGFIAGTAGVAFASGALVTWDARLFGPILVLDLWLLGYHHVIATYTRLFFDRDSRERHRFLILWLPILVLGATVALAAGVGLWVLGTTYLYWQWFHYTRQSWGLSQIYRRKSGGLVTEGDLLLKATIYLVPLWGILHRSWQAPEKFLGLELRVIPVPGLLVDIVAAAAVGAVALWTFQRLRAFWRGEGPIAHSLYMVSHLVVFAVSYLAIEDVTYGWLVVNIWHNAQYVLFVWLYNTNRFRGGVESGARLLSSISQPGNWWRYFLFCLGVTTLIYGCLQGVGAWLLAPGLPTLIVIYQTINFHHYIVDALIWKVRQAPIQKTLNLPAA